MPNQQQAAAKNPVRQWRFDMLLPLMVVAMVVLLFLRFGGNAFQEDRVELLPGTCLPENVGLPEAAAASLPLDKMPKSGEPVCFLMMNVHNYFVAGEPQRSRYTVKPKPHDACEAVADVLAAKKPHLVGLIEIGGPLALEDLQQRLRSRGLVYPYTRVLTRGGEDRALAILSQLPIVVDVSQANYGLYGQQRRKLLRGILDVTVRTQDERFFRILGVHLKSRVSEDAAAATSLRQREAHTVAKYIQHITRQQPQMPLLLFGDWNDGPADESVRMVCQGVSKDASMRRLKPTDSRGEEWTLYYSGGGVYNIFDMVMVNKALSRRLKSPVPCGIIDIEAAHQASDHRAIWCELR